jgi:SOS-response transcriptional repressor LexA
MQQQFVPFAKLDLGGEPDYDVSGGTESKSSSSSSVVGSSAGSRKGTDEAKLRSMSRSRDSGRSSGSTDEAKLRSADEAELRPGEGKRSGSSNVGSGSSEGNSSQSRKRDREGSANEAQLRRSNNEFDYPEGGPYRGGHAEQDHSIGGGGIEGNTVETRTADDSSTGQSSSTRRTGRTGRRSIMTTRGGGGGGGEDRSWGSEGSTSRERDSSGGGGATSRRRGETTPEEYARGIAFARWLRSARAMRGWTQKRLQEESGVSDTYVGVLEADGVNKSTGSYQRPSEDVIHRLASALACDEEAGRLAAGYSRTAVPDNPLKRFATPVADEMVYIPLLGTVRAGEPVLAPSNIEEIVAVPRDFIPYGEERITYALRVRGNSMAGVGIFEGDRIVVRLAETALDGQYVVALCGEGHPTVKRFRRPDPAGGAYLEDCPGSGTAKREAIPLEAPWRIIGVATHVDRELP